MTTGTDQTGTTELAHGFCFGEGPRWFEGLLWFSDMLGEAVHTVTLSGAMTTLPLPGHSPSGLGFRPDGTLLIVSTQRRQVLRYDGDSVDLLADLSDLAPSPLGDLVVDEHGRAYVGSQARTDGVIVRIDPDDQVTLVAEHLDFPNGMVITPDGTTLIVAESTARRLSAFTIDDDGGLTDWRLFTEGLDGPPDGLAIDAEGGVWAALTLAQEFQRFAPDGSSVTHRVDTDGRTAIACALGGVEGRTLFMVTTTDAYPERLVGTKLSRVDALMVETPAPGDHDTHHHH
ncbi:MULTISPECIES: SMP-30/gluconolactonase/LRE family protein [Mycolicibacterium]|uniref:Gluconolactonase n=1 Tax=Mycolicibacterium senegalense TaxID=1796 RepID=A0A378T336_9MYCO|nr:MULTISPECIES: SMP-30/gluconolactonase/LRE family protein [Mycolicibacterium]MCV7336007.1 SMP-30/gluconolactonase/LRE family protein [Mycolicibacterium senegalense]MDR7291058.1 sugar lactone lactonase YvrE [Mycolicibacterium senegalense]QZA22585.1 SMP-30/gluconolactonase/LRE family protein [Mycolicibacterium senegalense]CDP83408.1 gluconolactonase [Mycolicibacterium farcinogenes]STZ55222.1 gluconolactonase [Mycolicibacterium senegalense]